MANPTLKPKIIGSSLPFLKDNKLLLIRTCIYAFVVSLLIVLLYTLYALNSNIVNRKNENRLLYDTTDSQKELISSLENQLFKSENQIIYLNNLVLMQSDALEFIQKPNLKSIKLHNYKNKVMDQGKLLLDLPNKKALMLASNLDRLGEGSTYQIWAYINNDAVSLGTFDSDENSNAILKIEYLPNPDEIVRFAVTSEPRGGSAEPTGEMYLLGSK